MKQADIKRIGRELLINATLINWAIERIEKEYKEDIAVLVGRKGACKIPTDAQDVAFDFFIPATERGYSYAKTFIIDDMGYDLFPMSWERVAGIAQCNESLTEVLADGESSGARHFYEERNMKIRQ